jgi:predicted nucleic acid-binding protein
VSRVFVDTGAWIALADRRDRHHPDARLIVARLSDQRRPLVTTNHVIGETYTWLRYHLGGDLARRFLTRLREDAGIWRIHVSPGQEREAELLLEQFADQDFSYVDATSSVVMRQLGLNEAFAFDHHFAVAQFSLLVP